MSKTYFDTEKIVPRSAVVEGIIVQSGPDCKSISFRVYSTDGNPARCTFDKFHALKEGETIAFSCTEQSGLIEDTFELNFIGYTNVYVAVTRERVRN